MLARLFFRRVRNDERVTDLLPIFSASLKLVKSAFEGRGNALSFFFTIKKLQS